MPFVLNKEKVQDVGVAAQKATELKMLGRGKAAFKKAARAAIPEPVEVVATLTVDQRIAANLAKAVQNGKLVDLSVREDTHFVDLTL